MPRNPKMPDPPSEDTRWKIVNATMRRNGYQPDALIEVLHAVQENFGYLSEEGLVFVAESLGMPVSQVFGVATFYEHFSLDSLGEHICEVCMGTACYVQGATELIERVSEVFAIDKGETTPDNKLTLREVRCIGACSMAPAVVIDGKAYSSLTPDSLIEKLEEVVAS